MGLESRCSAHSARRAWSTHTKKRTEERGGTLVLPPLCAPCDDPMSRSRRRIQRPRTDKMEEPLAQLESIPIPKAYAERLAIAIAITTNARAIHSQTLCLRTKGPACQMDALPTWVCLRCVGGSMADSDNCACARVGNKADRGAAYASVLTVLATRTRLPHNSIQGVHLVMPSHANPAGTKDPHPPTATGSALTDRRSNPQSSPRALQCCRIATTEPPGFEVHASSQAAADEHAALHPLTGSDTSATSCEKLDESGAESGCARSSFQPHANIAGLGPSAIASTSKKQQQQQLTQASIGILDASMSAIPCGWSPSFLTRKGKHHPAHAPAASSPSLATSASSKGGGEAGSGKMASHWIRELRTDSATQFARQCGARAVSRSVLELDDARSVFLRSRLAPLRLALSIRLAFECLSVSFSACDCDSDCDLGERKENHAGARLAKLSRERAGQRRCVGCMHAGAERDARTLILGLERACLARWGHSQGRAAERSAKKLAKSRLPIGTSGV
ncbi:hypothetical protein L1887_60500 [Cichorium endivia]|nr:hypothetical protein L1887_60500 [Cichorium endivia]